MNYIPKRRNVNSNFFNKDKDNVTSNSNSTPSKNEDININLIPKTYNHPVPKSAMSHF